MLSTGTDTQDPKKWLKFAGDCEKLTEFLDSKNLYSPWIVLKFVVTFFRAFGQVLFANNPISGSIILVTMSVTNTYEAAIGSISAVIAIIFSLMIGQRSTDVSSGLTAFNPIMIGVAVASYNLTLFDMSLETAKMWFYLTTAIIIGAYLTSSLSGLLERVGLPCLSLPYNVVLYLLMVCVALDNSGPGQASSDSSDFIANLTVAEAVDPATGIAEAVNDSSDAIAGLMNHTKVDGDAVSWEGVFSGVVTSPSQVFNLSNVPLSSFMYLALVIYSPTTALFSALGAFAGTLLGVAFSSSTPGGGGRYAAVYNGTWGRSPLLTAATLAGQRYVLTPYTAAAAGAGAVLAALVHQVLPLATLPANLATLMMLGLVGRDRDMYPRPERVTFPERQRYEIITSLRMDDDDEGEDEDKEVAMK